MPEAVTVDFESLCQKARVVVERVLVRSNLVQAGQWIEPSADLKAKFSRASLLYRTGAYDDALGTFLDVSLQAEALRVGAGLTAVFNAAACAVALDRYDKVVELLLPVFQQRRLMGHPLWNLLLAFYRQGNTADALNALQMWIDRAPVPYRSRGLLLMAALAAESGDLERARSSFTRAIEMDRPFVMTQLGQPLGQPSVGGWTGVVGRRAAQWGLIPAATREHLLSLVQPKRPERRPELALLLTQEEMENFAYAIEDMTEGRHEQARGVLQQLRQKHPQIQYLDLALAATELFAERTEEARQILMQSEEASGRMPGFALWNLACAHIRLGDAQGAFRALNACAETEFRTKGQLYIALAALSGEEGRTPAPGGAARPRRGTQPPADRRPPRLSTSRAQARMEALQRLVKPRMVASAYKPDLGGLLRRDVQAIESVLQEARKADPTNAHSMLVPWLARHPGLYTLKVHAASYAVRAQNLNEARRYLHEAQELRALDSVSRMNLAYICLQESDYLGVTHALEGGENSTLAEKHDFWLALAIARAASQYGDAAGAAGRALSLATSPPTEKLVRETLQACGIQAAQPVMPEDPAVAAARDALQRLERRDIPGAAARLDDVCGEGFEKVPEINPRVFEPQFERVPFRRWGPELTGPFLAAVRAYDEHRYGDAAEEFRRLHARDHRGEPAALNMVAAYIKAGQHKFARSCARRALSGGRRPWRLVYNYALAIHLTNETQRAVRQLDHIGGCQSSAAALAVALCRTGIDTPALRKKIRGALERLQESTVPPSDELTLALAWSHLTQATPDVEQARGLVAQVIQRAEIQTLVPPAEANTMQLVRAAYEQLRAGGKGAEAVQYLNRIIETKEAERADMTPRQLERSVGVEFTARACLAAELHAQNERQQAIEALDRCELLLVSHEESIQPGFLARDWLELGKLSLDLGLPWAALRRAASGLRADPESVDLKDLKSHIEQGQNRDEMDLLNRAVVRLCSVAHQSDVSEIEKVRKLAQALPECELVQLRAPNTFRALTGLITPIAEAGDGDLESESRADEVGVLSRAELPEGGNEAVEALLEWVTRSFAKEQPRSPVDVEIYEDRIWPRSYEGEACALLMISATGEESPEITILDPISDKTIWRGLLPVGRTIPHRWVFEREDGFIADDQVEVQLLIQAHTPQGMVEHPLSLNVTVASVDPVWPNYPTGPLDPAEVPGGELYGRSTLIRRIVSSFGPTRCQATYLIEAVRQMGKTSLLKFLKQLAPKHTLPVYVSLEAIRSDPEGNVWNCVIEQIRREAGDDSFGPFRGTRHGDVLAIARKVCDRLNKAYLLLLMDELHVLLREGSNPKGALADFRADLEPSNRISILFADRYTLAESEKKVESEYWLQLTVLQLEPLDAASTVKAVNTPCEGTDARFLPETIERLYYWTQGYPFHVQRVVQNVIAKNLDGPWVTALPRDVDEVIPQMIEQDRLFQEGLCRKDRMDLELQCAIAGFLEWADLTELLPTLCAEPEWKEVLRGWAPQIQDLLAGIGDAETLLERLVAIGVMKKGDGRYDFFSPLLERWLRKMRTEGKSLLEGVSSSTWGLSPHEEAAKLTGADWRRLDADLMTRCQNAGIKPPLQITVPPSLELWDTLAREAGNREAFVDSFLIAAFKLIVDGRHEKTIYRYPWLALAYHRLRLVRNFFHHAGEKPTGVAISAWGQVFSRALGRTFDGEEPRSGEEWRAVQVALLRTLHIGLRNAIALAGGDQAQRAVLR